jgi:hypothetical protein
MLHILSRTPTDQATQSSTNTESPRSIYKYVSTNLNRVIQVAITRNINAKNATKNIHQHRKNKDNKNHSTITILQSKNLLTFRIT